MSVKFSGSSFGTLLMTPMSDSPYVLNLELGPIGPAPTIYYMIDEVNSDFMITESGDFMIAE